MKMVKCMIYCDGYISTFRNLIWSCSWSRKDWATNTLNSRSWKGKISHSTLGKIK